MLHQPVIPSVSRRRLIGAALACCCGAARAEPSTTTAPLRLLVGAAPGSAMDIMGRQIGEAYAAQTGQVVLVDNRPTAGGILALDMVRRAPPDGLTVGLVHAMQMTAAPALFPKLPYDPATDFTHLGILFVGQQVLVVSPSLAVRRWADLVNLAKQRPSGLRYATPGIGSPQHLSMELLRTRTGVALQHIPYRGPAAIQAVLSGEVDMTLEGVALLLPQIQSGRVVPLALGGSQRIDALPGVPTFSELGVAGIGEVWIGLVAPLGLPASVRASLHDAMSRAMLSLRAEYQAAGRIVEPGSGDAMSETIHREAPVWHDVIRTAGITVD
ncbi:MAG: tripartite tricarboxylate transporter substrate binding protein [Proteobacteria bacterium]|nr:tripartite tricarboxylate transporter substrate binding protein [Pseudomonadota bacterium]